MINSEKIGKFIAELRIKRKLSQEKLGNLIGIGRDSISKWERGVTLPSHEMLLKLSEIFDVTVNEILYGECLNNYNAEKINEVSAYLYEDSKKGKKIIKYLFFVIIFMLALFGIYYFINSYKSIKVYTISGAGDSVSIDNGVFINTYGRLYFSINELDVKKNLNIKKLTLYYKDIENMIYSGDCTNIFISDYYGANEYFDKEYLKDINNNLYLLVEYDNDESEEIKLHFTQDYVNDILFFKKEKQTITDKKENNLDLIPTDLNYLISNIEKTFNKKDDIYIYNKTIKNLEYSAFYIPNNGSIILSVSKKGNIIEEWSFDTYSKSLVYNLYDGSDVLHSFIYENMETQCLIGKCENSEEKIEFFWKYLYELKGAK